MNNSVAVAKNVHHAAAIGDINYIKLFIAELNNYFHLSTEQIGKELSSINYQYETPLHIATINNNISIVELFLSHHVNINAKNMESGYTALHIAMLYGYLTVAGLLLQYGADYIIKDKEGKTPFDLLPNRLHAKLFQLDFLQQQRAVEQEDEEEKEDKSACKACYQVSSLGFGRNYQLGINSDKYESRPRFIKNLKSCNIVDAAVNKYITLLLDARGATYSCGIGRFGVLGHNSLDTQILPKRIQAVKHRRIVAVSEGGIHAALLADNGEVYVMGTLSYLGLEQQKCNTLEANNIAAASTGQNKKKQGNFINQQPQSQPKQANRHSNKAPLIPDDLDEFSLDSGANSLHNSFSAIENSVATPFEKQSAPEHDDEENDAEIRNSSVPLTVNCPVPRRLESFRGIFITQIAACEKRLILLSDSNELYILGELLENHKIEQTARVVRAIPPIEIAQISTTNSSIVLLSGEGEVFQQMRGDRSYHKVAFKFSAAAQFHVRSAERHAAAYDNISVANRFNQGAIGHRNDRHFNKSGVRIVKIAVSNAAERAVAVTNSGDAYWWKLRDKSPAEKLKPGLELTTPSYSPPLHPLIPPTSSPKLNAADSSRGSTSSRRVATQILGLREEFIVDAIISKHSTTLLTKKGELFTFGSNLIGLEKAGTSAAKPTRMHNVAQVTKLWGSELHLILSTAYITPPKFAIYHGLSAAVLSLKQLCAAELASHVQIDTVLAAYRFAFDLQSSELLEYCAIYLIINYKLLGAASLFKLSPRQLKQLEFYYHSKFIVRDKKLARRVNSNVLAPVIFPLENSTNFGQNATNFHNLLLLEARFRPSGPENSAEPNYLQFFHDYSTNSDELDGLDEEFSALSVISISVEERIGKWRSQLRALKKKLGQIERIASQEAEGVELQAEQQLKLAGKGKIQQQISKIQQELLKIKEAGGSNSQAMEGGEEKDLKEEKGNENDEKERQRLSELAENVLDESERADQMHRVKLAKLSLQNQESLAVENSHKNNQGKSAEEISPVAQASFVEPRVAEELLSRPVSLLPNKRGSSDTIHSATSSPVIKASSALKQVDQKPLAPSPPASSINANAWNKAQKTSPNNLEPNIGAPSHSADLSFAAIQQEQHQLDKPRAKPSLAHKTPLKSPPTISNSSPSIVGWPKSASNSPLLQRNSSDILSADHSSLSGIRSFSEIQAEEAQKQQQLLNKPQRLSSSSNMSLKKSIISPLIHSATISPLINNQLSAANSPAALNLADYITVPPKHKSTTKTWNNSAVPAQEARGKQNKPNKNNRNRANQSGKPLSFAEIQQLEEAQLQHHQTILSKANKSFQSHSPATNSPIIATAWNRSLHSNVPPVFNLGDIQSAQLAATIQREETKLAKKFAKEERKKLSPATNNNNHTSQENKQAEGKACSVFEEIDRYQQQRGPRKQ
jgi:hypothetical protein